MLKLRPDERVLDVGCGIGQLPHLDPLATLKSALDTVCDTHLLRVNVAHPYLCSRRR